MNTIETTMRMWSVLFFYLLATTLQATEPNNSKSIIIDGSLDDPIWFKSQKTSNLVQIEPDILAPSAVQSEFYFTHDAQNIYIGGRLYEEKGVISASNARKDDEKITRGDYITIGLDPLNNGNSAYFFRINPVNAQADGIIDIDGNFDCSWDAVFVSETKITDHYWTFEMKIPLTSITFQNKKTQDWGVMFSRYYANAQELSINRIADKNAPFRISLFPKIEGISELKKRKNIIFTPYVFGFAGYSALRDSIEQKGKLGGEIKYNPNPSTTIYMTVNPDYAQIETDKEVINVSDIPTTYPEKRMFFTESSDMYPGLAVNTRNITDINAGIKVRKVGANAKMDFTAVYDKEKNIWGTTDIRLTDNSNYHFEVISGIKSNKTNYLKDYNYNITLHGKLYFFDKKMQIYTWYGTVNMKDGRSSEYESVNAVKWISRFWNAGVWNHMLSQLYNPGIVGTPTLSNQFVMDGWIGYTLYNSQGFLRKMSLTTHVLRYALFTSNHNVYYENANEMNNQIYMGKILGNWTLNLTYKPALNAKFRYRNSQNFNHQQEYIDNIGPFVQVDQKATTFIADIKSDASKFISAGLSYDNSLVRKSRANNVSLNLFLRLSSKMMLDYSFNSINVKGSAYQIAYRQTIHRIKAEYNFTKKMNLRFVFQPISTRQPFGILNTNYNKNITLSWEFIPGGNLFIVYNNFKNADTNIKLDKQTTANDHSLVCKISKSF
jgi:hypothetical protein